MQKQMLIIVSGPDRVGKSTLIQRIASEAREDVLVRHHGAPPQDQKSIFDFYKDDINDWLNNHHEKICVFDRAWPCSYILEQHRRRNAGHFEDIVNLELWINENVPCPVVHVAQLRPWHWSAPLHVDELKELHPDAADWFIADEYVARMGEHKVYTEQLLDFYENFTMFPHLTLTSTRGGWDVLQQCRLAVQDSGR